MIKTWLISASAPICGTETYYIAYAEDSPESLKNWQDIENTIIEELWDNYSYLLHLDDEEYASEEEEIEAYDQAYEDWKYDCTINIDEATQEDLEEIASDGDLESVEIVYDERK